jgi:hypothetical protein
VLPALRFIFGLTYFQVDHYIIGPANAGCHAAQPEDTAAVDSLCPSLAVAVLQMVR